MLTPQVKEGGKVIEIAKKSDYEKILRFLESAYGHFFNFFPLTYPNEWGEENFDYENTLIIKEEGQIVSLVKVFPLPMVFEGIEVKFAGIGSVSTAYSHRGKGYMSELLNECFEKMKKENYPLSILWGDRHRYQNFGYEVAGKKVYITITSRGMAKNKIESAQKTERFLGDRKILNKIISAYNLHPYRKIRTEEEMSEKVLKKFSPATYYLEGQNKFAYVSISREREILEFGGDEKLILKILKYLEERFGYSSFSLFYPDFEHIPDLIFSTASSWQICPDGMIKIVDLFQTLKTFSKKFLSIPENFEITFSTEIQSAILRKEKGDIIIKNGKGKNEIFLNEIDMVKLFFGTDFWKPKGESKEILNILKSVLPINVFIWPLDHI